MKRFICALCILLSLCCCLPHQAYASSKVGETVTFTAGNSKETVTGTTTIDTRTEKQKTADETNIGLYNTNHSIVEGWKYTLDISQSGTYIPGDNKYVMVWKASVPKVDLIAIAGSAGQYDNNGTYEEYKKTSKKESWSLSSPTANAEEMNALVEAIYLDGFGVLYTKTETDTEEWITSGDHPKWIDLLKYRYELVSNSNSGYWTRIFLTGNGIFIDFDSYVERYTALKHYIDEYVSEEVNEVNVAYIVEYEISDVARSALYSSTPLNWPGTQQTHFWEIQGYDSPTGIKLGSIERFSNEDLTQTFYHAGKYHITATQIMEHAYWNAITYNKCEYWVVADTGQIIWKSETQGSQIYNGAPMAGQGLQNFRPYQFVSLGTYYVTQCDTIHQVTDDTLQGGYKIATPWGNIFETVRIH